MKKLLWLPLNIISGTLALASFLALTIIGIPAAILVLICGLGLALVAFVMILFPLIFLLFI
jgi:hypothetical protein